MGAGEVAAAGCCSRLRASVQVASAPPPAAPCGSWRHSRAAGTQMRRGENCRRRPTSWWHAPEASQHVAPPRAAMASRSWRKLVAYCLPPYKTDDAQSHALLMFMCVESIIAHMSSAYHTRPAYCTQGLAADHSRCSPWEVQAVASAERFQECPVLAAQKHLRQAKTNRP